MRLYVTYKVSQEAADDIDIVQYNAGVYKEQRISHLRKGIKLRNERVRTGYDQDDFAMNLFTVMITSDAVKVPRIIAKRLLKILKAR